MTTTRTQAMIAARRSGATLDEIGKQWGLTRERVRQILVEAGGPTATEARQLAARDRQARVDAWIFAHPGATAEDAAAELGMSPAQVRANASPNARARLVRVQARHRQYSDRQIQAALRAASARIGGHPLSWNHYGKLVSSGQVDGPSAVRVIQRYVTWADACKAAGIKSGAAPNRAYSSKWTDEQMLELVLEYLNATDGTGSYGGWDAWRAEHHPDGPSAQTMRNRLGTWSQIKTRALWKQAG